MDVTKRATPMFWILIQARRLFTRCLDVAKAAWPDCGPFTVYLFTLTQFFVTGLRLNSDAFICSMGLVLQSIANFWILLELTLNWFHLLIWFIVTGICKSESLFLICSGRYVCVAYRAKALLARVTLGLRAGLEGWMKWFDEGRFGEVAAFTKEAILILGSHGPWEGLFCIICRIISYEALTLTPLLRDLEY